jgi:DNA polymerase-3 subunit epsilon
LVARLPSSSSFDDAPDEYFTLLDRVLEDRLVEAQEIQNLEQLAQDNGMSKEQAETAHREYLRNLMMVARSDGVLSSVELVDLKEVSRLLGIPVKDFDDLMSETDETEAEVGDLCNKDSAAADDIRGKSVCFTGAMLSKVNGNPVTRDFAQQAASDCGMVIQKGVTKTLDYLVVADPESMSGKAKKARKYEVRIIAEAVFWQMVGVDLV